MFRFPPLTPTVRALLIGLVTLFVAEAILQNFFGVPLFEWLALDPAHLSPATTWQVLTHALAPNPNDLLNLLLTSAFIWLILAPFEARYGRDRVIQLAVVAALAAALPAVAVGQVVPRLSGLIAGPQTITLAAICAYAVMLPAHAEVSFFGVFPMRPKHLIGVVAGFSLLGFIMRPNAAQLAADIGAIAGGVGFCKLWMQRPPRPRRAPPRGKSKGGPKLHAVRNDDDDPGKRWLN